MYRYLLETMQKEANRQKATYVIIGRESNTVYVRYGRGLTVTDEYVERYIDENTWKQLLKNTKAKRHNYKTYKILIEDIKREVSKLKPLRPSKPKTGE